MDAVERGFGADEIACIELRERDSQRDLRAQRSVRDIGVARGLVEHSESALGFAPSHVRRADQHHRRSVVTALACRAESFRQQRERFGSPLQPQQRACAQDREPFRVGDRQRTGDVVA